MPAPSSKAVICFNSGSEKESLSELSEIKRYIADTRRELKAVYHDKKAAEPKDLAAFLSFVKKARADTVAVYELSRLGKDRKELINNINLLEKENLNLVSVREKIDTAKQGALVFSLLGIYDKAIRKIESAERKRKVKKGIEEARAKGKKLGRPGVPDKKIEEARTLYQKGLTFGQIGKLLDLNESTVRKKLRVKN